MLEAVFKKHGRLEENFSVDGSMMSYSARHYAKQFIRGIPIHFGFKYWALCSCEEYMITFKVYNGKDSDRIHQYGLRGDSVLSLINVAGVRAHGGRKVFFDNYFTSVKILKHLASIGICAAGTVQENRMEKCPLKCKQDMKEERR
jgi:DNA excision repair protein ERCC-6